MVVTKLRAVLFIVIALINVIDHPLGPPADRFELLMAR
jgi:hypothetical protein